MKNLLSILALLLAFSFTASAQVQFPHSAKINTRINSKINYPVNFVYQPNCPDLQAASVNFQVVRRYSQYSGLVKVTGTVKNIGKQHFVGNASQMAIILYEVRPGGSTRILRKASYPSINSGQSKSISTYVRWSTSNEFPPSYRISIVYDPDIKMDGNPRNDDCNSANNRKQRSGTDINRLFSAG